MRTARAALRPRSRPSARGSAVVTAMVVTAMVLTACGGSSSGSTPTLNLHIYPDNSGAVQDAVNNCNVSANGAYKITYQKLPNGADGQRQQMVRRLAAKDSSMDILGLDVTWAPEFAEAGWIRQWTGDNKAQVMNGTLQGPLDTATY